MASFVLLFRQSPETFNMALITRAPFSLSFGLFDLYIYDGGFYFIHN